MSSNTVNVSTTTNQVVITPQSTKTVSVNSGDNTSITVNQGASNTITVSDNVVNTSLTPNTINITTPPSNGITVTDLRKTITVNQGTTSIVNVNTVGPQGPIGPQGPPGPSSDIVTGSLLKTASITDATITFTKGDSSTFDIEVDNVTSSISASYVSSSGNIIADSITLSTSSVQDTYMLGFSRTTDGIAQRSSYFLSFNNTSTALKNSNAATNFPISASDYYNRVIPCDDMTIADGKSIDITGMLIVSGANDITSKQVKIDLYTASITPNNTTNITDPLTFTRAFQGSNIVLDISAPYNSIHHFTQSFDISTLPTNSLIAVALSNSSGTIAVTTNTNVSISLRLTRNYKKKN